MEYLDAVIYAGLALAAFSVIYLVAQSVPVVSQEVSSGIELSIDAQRLLTTLLSNPGVPDDWHLSGSVKVVGLANSEYPQWIDELKLFALTGAVGVAQLSNMVINLEEQQLASNSLQDWLVNDMNITELGFVLPGLLVAPGYRLADISYALLKESLLGRDAERYNLTIVVLPALRVFACIGSGNYDAALYPNTGDFCSELEQGLEAGDLAVCVYSSMPVTVNGTGPQPVINAYVEVRGFITIEDESGRYIGPLIASTDTRGCALFRRVLSSSEIEAIDLGEASAVLTIKIISGGLRYEGIYTVVNPSRAPLVFALPIYNATTRTVRLYLLHHHLICSGQGVSNNVVCDYYDEVCGQPGTPPALGIVEIEIARSLFSEIAELGEAELNPGVAFNPNRVCEDDDDDGQAYSACYVELTPLDGFAILTVERESEAQNQCYPEEYTMVVPIGVRASMTGPYPIVIGCVDSRVDSMLRRVYGNYILGRVVSTGGICGTLASYADAVVSSGYTDYVVRLYAWSWK